VAVPDALLRPGRHEISNENRDLVLDAALQYMAIFAESKNFGER
jgi:hypothetical protein